MTTIVAAHTERNLKFITLNNNSYNNDEDIVLGASIIAEQQSKRSVAAVARRQSERTMIQIPLWPPDKTADKTVPQHLQQETRDLTAVVIRSSISSLDGHDKGTSVRDFRNTASKRQR
ncbi:hypothetical protein IV203_000069 [Nitzschia inconspicua]|uniref:Uncharacterized protein n=1 Tax=Nitzschia inconspicua TaxID=303405 RepID=A0A9K3L654_9STRA|nr:hypothetical protein IV203_000069 [Nitzschia inconspicua]